MKISNTTESEIRTALEKINVKYENNVIIDKITPANKKNTAFNVKLKVANSRGKGSRIGFSTNKDGSKRRLASACFHAFGYFIMALREINSDVVIHSNGKKIDRDSTMIDIWEDRNIGSMMQPLYYSEACDCIDQGID